MDRTERFWYRNRTRAGTEFVLVDPTAATRAPAFDHSRVAEALSAAYKRSIEPAGLPIHRLEMRVGEPLRIHTDNDVWFHDPLTADTWLSAESAVAAHESLSPDGRWTVSVRDHNLVARERATGEERVLTSDGVEGCSIGTPPDILPMRYPLKHSSARLPPMVAWSSDSRWLVTHRIDERAVASMPFAQSSPPDGRRPRVHLRRMALVGDATVPMVELMVVSMETGQIISADCAPYPISWYFSPFVLGTVWWDHAGDHICFISSERGDRLVRLSRIDPATGQVRILVEETGEGCVQTRPDYPGRPNVHVLASGETIWWSERTGSGHLYLYGGDGAVRSLTAGEWLVRDLIGVDEVARFAIFSASGREGDIDPYVRQIYRVELDDAKIERLTSDRLDHEVIASPRCRYLVDTASWIDVPPTSAVLDTNGAAAVALEQADADFLYEAGWVPPQRFRVRTADGKTDLYGLLYRPPEFDEKKRYPVLDDIYPGPQANRAGIRFGEPSTRMAASMAALGFAVVVIDARGTPLRDRAFQDHCRGVASADYLEDHVHAIRQLAIAHPWLNADCVGIYGASGGGRAAAQAILRHPTFFKVAVSVSGNHDDRLYHAFWGEKYIGSPDAVDYATHANTTYAEQLAGKLMLIHGEMDDNVGAFHTLRLVDALMAANKDFDLLIVPNAGHQLQRNHAYSIRRTWDYFVRHLLNREPPPYRIEDIPDEIESFPQVP